MIEPKIINKIEASKAFNKLISSDFSEDNKELDKEHLLLKEDLTRKYKSILKRDPSPYEKDLFFGLYLYDTLNRKYDLSNNNTLSANMGFWYYLSIFVIPLIVKERWDKKSDRFFDRSNRVWLYTLWWYIHLSWQDDEEKTLNVLKGFSTDTIVQVVERTGKGFDRELTRAIVREFSKRKYSQDLLRSAMTFNTAYVNTLEPKLYIDGYEGYVKMIFDKAEGK